MSQGPREPQSKWRRPEGAPSDIPPKDDVPAVDVPAVDVPPTEVAVAGATKPEETKALVVPAPAPAAPAAVPAPAAAAHPPLPAAPPLLEPAPPAVAPHAVPAAPAPVAPAPTAPVPGLAARSDAVSLAGDSALDDEPAPPLTLRDRLRRLSPVFVTMIVGSIGSTVFLALAVTSHTTPVAVLVGAAVVTTLVFALDAVMCTAVTYRAGQDEEAGRALLFAVLGGISAVICALAMAGTLILILVLNS